MINFTIDGNKIKQLFVGNDVNGTDYLINQVKHEFGLNSSDEIHLFDDSFNRIHNLESISGGITTFYNSIKIALLNINRVHETGSNHSAIQNTGVTGDEMVRDTVSTNTYSCIYKKCRKTYNRCDKLFKHYETHFKSKPYACEYQGCGKRFLYQSQLDNHYTTHMDTKNFKCTFPGCQKSYAK